MAWHKVFKYLDLSIEFDIHHLLNFLREENLIVKDEDDKEYISVNDLMILLDEAKTEIHLKIVDHPFPPHEKRVQLSLDSPKYMLYTQLSSSSGK